MQILDKPDFLKIITDKLKQEEYDFESFKFNVKIPLGISVRCWHKTILNSQEIIDDEILGNDIKSILNHTDVDMKAVIKWTLAP